MYIPTKSIPKIKKKMKSTNNEGNRIEIQQIVRNPTRINILCYGKFYACNK